MAKILVGEPNIDLSISIKNWFSLADNYNTQVETSSWRLLEHLSTKSYDVIILNVTLPGIDSLNLIRRFRTGGGITPIILIAAGYNSAELQSGLDAGADAYLAQPFLLADLSAIVRAQLRRPQMLSQTLLTWGGVSLNCDSGLVSRDDIPLHLHPMEFKLLQFFLSHPNEAFSANALSKRLWQKDFGLANDTVRSHIRTLRKKIDSVGFTSVITTVRGFGYKTEIQRAIPGFIALPIDEDISAVILQSR